MHLKGSGMPNVHHLSVGKSCMEKSICILRMLLSVSCIFQNIQISYSYIFQSQFSPKDPEHHRRDKSTASSRCLWLMPLPKHKYSCKWSQRQLHRNRKFPSPFFFFLIFQIPKVASLTCLNLPPVLRSVFLPFCWQQLISFPCIFPIP